MIAFCGSTSSTSTIIRMSTATTTQTTILPTELIGVPPVQDLAQSLTEDTPNTTPQQPRLVHSPDHESE
jgi:hypothetical protein